MPRCVLQKSFPESFSESEIPVVGSFSNIVKGLQGVRLATLLKRDSLTDVSESAVRRCSTE